MSKKVRINQEIRDPEIRVIAEDGGNLGIMSGQEANSIARSRGLDLIEIAATSIPPVAKIMDFGKFSYLENKKQKLAKAKAVSTETKSIQVKVATGDHDLELKGKQASEFLKEGHKVKVELYLRGRAKYMGQAFQKERLDRVLKTITEPYKFADSYKQSPKGLMVVLERDTKKKN